MPVRIPVVAGQFYPGSAKSCRAEIETCLAAAQRANRGPIAGRAVGGIVPHAGWVFSGAVATEVIRVLAADAAIETFVVFGAVHRYVGESAPVWVSGSWETPLGEIAIDEELAAASIQACELIVDDPRAHASEHSIEVQVPFLQQLAPSARLLPVMVPPTPTAHEVGRIVAEQARALGRKTAFIGSTDLTHYGPRYGFTPKGSGPEGLRWAKEVNDRRVLDLIVDMQADQIVAEARQHQNACGGGAVAAAIGACRVAGADQAVLLCHTTSNEVARERYGEMSDAVGYAGVVFTSSLTPATGKPQ